MQSVFLSDGKIEAFLHTFICALCRLSSQEIIAVAHPHLQATVSLLRLYTHFHPEWFTRVVFFQMYLFIVSLHWAGRHMKTAFGQTWELHIKGSVGRNLPIWWREVSLCGVEILGPTGVIKVHCELMRKSGWRQRMQRGSPQNISEQLAINWFMLVIQ